jgi:hypothetical protein
MAYEYKKSQSSTEFIILIGFILFVFTVFILIVNENMSDRMRQQQNLMIKDLALSVQNEIDMALEASDGYQRRFNIPDKIANKNYEINITQSMVYIRTLDGKNAMAIPVKNVSGDVVKGTNLIKKENGEIKINI